MRITLDLCVYLPSYQRVPTELRCCVRLGGHHRSWLVFLLRSCRWGCGLGLWAPRMFGVVSGWLVECLLTVCERDVTCWGTGGSTQQQLAYIQEFESGQESDGVLLCG